LRVMVGQHRRREPRLPSQYCGGEYPRGGGE
jgi:hypothetical protein